MNTRSLVSRIKKANKNRLYEIFGGSEQSVRLSDELFPKALEVLELLIKHLKANKVEVIVSNEGQIYLGYEGEYIQLVIYETYEHEYSKGDLQDFEKYGVASLTSDQVTQRFILKLTALRRNNCGQSFDINFTADLADELALFFAEKFYRYARHAKTFVSPRLPINKVEEEPVIVEYALIKLIAYLIGNDSVCAQILRSYREYHDCVLFIDGELRFEEEFQTKFLKRLNQKEFRLLRQYLG
jgi:hypothetical protein